MKIEHILKRHGGTEIRIDDTDYHFAPNDAGDHVAEVIDFAHIQRLLLIPEGFRPYDAAGLQQAADLETQDNELSDIEQAVVPASADFAQMTAEELRAEYQRIFGRLAPPLIKHDTLLRKLTAARLPSIAVPESNAAAGTG